MKTTVFYFLFLLNSADSCLKINYAEPPTCACKSLALDSSNMQNEIGSVAFYQNVSAYPLKAPVISNDDCSITVSCEGDYSLVVFDTDKATMFDKYSADGFCDSFTQTWKVDKDGSESFTTFQTLRGLCVEYSPPINCKSCGSVLDIFQLPTDDQGYTYTVLDLEGNGYCRLNILLCVRNSTEDSCESSTVYAVNNEGTHNATTLWNEKYAESHLQCGDNGVYTLMYTRGSPVENISKVYCEFKNCVKTGSN